MWIMIMVTVLIVGVACDAALRYYAAKTHRALEVMTWSLEGLLLTFTIAGLLYQFVSGHVW
jgi:hypothetical protein